MLILPTSKSPQCYNFSTFVLLQLENLSGSYLLFSFGVMNGSFMLVKIHDSIKRRRRPMQVIVSPDLTASDVIMMSQVAWYNLGGRFLDEDYYVSIKVLSYILISHVTSCDQWRNLSMIILLANVSRISIIHRGDSYIPLLIIHTGFM